MSVDASAVAESVLAALAKGAVGVAATAMVSALRDKIREFTGTDQPTRKALESLTPEQIRALSDLLRGPSGGRTLQAGEIKGRNVRVTQQGGGDHSVSVDSIDAREDVEIKMQD